MRLLLKLEPKLPEENNEFQDDMYERKIQCSSEATGIAIAVAIIAARCREFDEGRRGKGTLTTVHELKWAASMELKSRIERDGAKREEKEEEKEDDCSRRWEGENGGEREKSQALNH